MAGDSCWTGSYGGGIDTLSKKIMRLKSGALLGQAGDNDARDVLKLLIGVKSHRNLPSRSDLMAIRCDFTGLLVFPSGRIFKISTTFVSPENWTEDVKDDFGVWEIEGGMATIGSGADFAMGAMEAGASARRAVQIACRRDINSRPPIHSLTLA